MFLQEAAGSAARASRQFVGGLTTDIVVLGTGYPISPHFPVPAYMGIGKPAILFYQDGDCKAGKRDHQQYNRKNQYFKKHWTWFDCMPVELNCRSKIVILPRTKHYFD